MGNPGYPGYPMNIQRYAFAFVSPLKLDDMLPILEKMTPSWRWQERDNDRDFGGYLEGVEDDSIKLAFARVIEEDGWFAAELIFEPYDIGDDEAKRDLERFDAKFFDELLPALGATGLKPTNTYES